MKSGIDKKVDVVFCGWQENGDGRSILLVTEIESNSTMVYDPVKHNGLNVKKKNRNRYKASIRVFRREREIVKILKESVAQQQALIKELIEDGLSQNRVIIKLKRELKLKKTSEIDIRGLRCL